MKCRYTVADAAGNAANTAFRYISVTAKCPSSERWCVEDQACSFKGQCGVSATSLYSLSSLIAATSDDAGADEYGGDYADDASTNVYVLDGFANLDTVETSMAAYQYDDEEPEQQQIVVVEEVQDTVPPVVQVQPGEVRYLAATGMPSISNGVRRVGTSSLGLSCHPEPLMQHMKYGIILGMFLLPIHRTVEIAGAWSTNKQRIYHSHDRDLRNGWAQDRMAIRAALSRLWGCSI